MGQVPANIFAENCMKCVLICVLKVQGGSILKKCLVKIRIFHAILAKSYDLALDPKTSIPSQVVGFEM